MKNQIFVRYHLDVYISSLDDPLFFFSTSLCSRWKNNSKMLILLRINFGSRNWEFWLKVGWCGEPLISTTRQILTLAWVDPGRLKRKFSVTEVSRLVEAASKAVTKPTQQILSSTIQLGAFQLSGQSFLYDFCSVVRQMLGYNAKKGHGPHALPGTVASTKCLSTVTW